MCRVLRLFSQKLIERSCSTASPEDCLAVYPCKAILALRWFIFLFLASEILCRKTRVLNALSYVLGIAMEGWIN